MKKKRKKETSKSKIKKRGEEGEEDERGKETQETLKGDPETGPATGVSQGVLKASLIYHYNGYISANSGFTVPKPM